MIACGLRIHNPLDTKTNRRIQSTIQSRKCWNGQISIRLTRNGWKFRQIIDTGIWSR